MYLGVSRSTLAMYRMRWNQAGSGTGTGADGCGPLFFEGPSGRIGYRIEDLDVWRNRTRNPALWKPAQASKRKK